MNFTIYEVPHSEYGDGYDLSEATECWNSDGIDDHIVEQVYFQIGQCINPDGGLIAVSCDELDECFYVHQCGWNGEVSFLNNRADLEDFLRRKYEMELLGRLPQ